ncbi:MAG: NAD(P)-dependent oxidoreductase, partial [Candidatus Beckwithbacteria bacterium]|nr:NAD(P)-dependent oxidoreductase [Candidatus Beckwithbacteria bacterium]
VDSEYFKKRRIPVSNIPGYSRESVAEHTLALLLNLAKRIIVTDRKTRTGQYQLEMGFELKDKTLGIIGLGSIGSRVAELAQGIGMKVIAYNRSPKTQKGVIMKSLNQVLKQADALSLHVIDSQETRKMIGSKQIKLMKEGVIIVNTADRGLIDEAALAKALKSGKVYGYAYEAEDLEHTPLAKLENAIGIKGFGWYTKEALQRLTQIWVDNIAAIAKGKPQNVVH